MEYPTRDELGDDLSGLLGAEVLVTNGVLDPSKVSRSTYEFVDDDDTPRCVVSTELPLAHAAGAALAMLPTGRVESDAPDDELLEFYREVVNVISGRVNLKSPTHIRLVPGSTGEGSWPGGAGSGTCYQVTVGDYGTGHIAFADI